MRCCRYNVTNRQQLDMKDNRKLLFFNDCNFQVALLCNHCKTPAKNFGDKQEEKKKQLLEMEKARAAPCARALEFCFACANCADEGAKRFERRPA